MEKSRWCDVCKRDKCIHDGGVNDMGFLKPSCYVEIEMVEFDGDYVPKELCTIDRLGGADDCVPCHESCTGECNECVVTKVFNEYARLTKQTKVREME